MEEINFIKHIYLTTTDDKVKKEIESKYPAFILSDNVARFNDTVDILGNLLDNPDGKSPEEIGKIMDARQWLLDNKDLFTNHGDRLTYATGDFLIWATDDIQKLLDKETDEEAKKMYRTEIKALKEIASTYPEYQFDRTWLMKVGDFIWANKKGTKEEVQFLEECSYRLWSTANRKKMWEKEK